MKELSNLNFNILSDKDVTKKHWKMVTSKEKGSNLDFEIVRDKYPILAKTIQELDRLKAKYRDICMELAALRNAVYTDRPTNQRCTKRKACECIDCKSAKNGTPPNNLPSVLIARNTRAMVSELSKKLRKDK